MANLRQIRSRISSVKTIQQITRAMKMVASARLHRAQTQLLAARPYAQKMNEMVRNIAGRVRDTETPLLKPGKGTIPAFLVLTSDKGLCAGFNVSPLQAAGAAYAAAAPGQKPEIMVAGRKGVGFFRRTEIKAYREWAGFWQDLNLTHADLIGQDVIEAYSSGRWSSLTLIYNRFKSRMSQELSRVTLLPVSLPSTWPDRPAGGYVFEPNASEVLDYLLPRFVKNALWHALLESKAAELAARMQAMENATQSAKDMIADMTLNLNRARQGAITREISELVAGAEAINA